MVQFQTRSMTLGIDSRGSIDGIVARGTGKDYLAMGQPSPVMKICVKGEFHVPGRAIWDDKVGTLTLDYGRAGVTAVLNVQAKSTHVVLALAGVAPVGKVELVQWGPYPITIGSIVGEIVGVARDAEYAIGIQALNPKTIGGSPDDEDDALASGCELDDRGTYVNLLPELNKQSLFRGSTAWPTPFGSVLQLYCRDRSKDRIVSNWGHEKYLAQAIADGGVVGSKVALFGCPTRIVLDTISEVEVTESLPHPTIGGVWAKKSPLANSSYLIVDFGEGSIDRAIDLTRRAGLHHLYHSSPFATWGHFLLRRDLFPNGWDGFKACVDKAREAGITVGFHTLSNFTTPNDAYVQPKPDPRLARVGSSALTADIDATVEEIPVEFPDYFRKETDMNTVAIADELIHFTSISEAAPWTLLGCERGEWGTSASPHKRGDPVGRIMGHGYKVFLTDADLAQEEARTIAAFCNKTGALRLSMDGLEGNWSTGHGQYGRILFMYAWYEALSPELRGRVLNDASNAAHFNWHVNTYFNWGEPWYAGFRESQTLYRFKNQVFYERNFIPKMLGWFALRPDTTVEDAEWLLAKAAGYDAGFTLAMSPASTAQLVADPTSTDTSKIGALPAILEAIKQWEAARLGNAFPEGIKAELRDDRRVFHLEFEGPGRWNLFPVESSLKGKPVEIHSERLGL